MISGRVQLFDNFEGNEYLLGSATLNECGYYQITYQKSQFQHGIIRAYPELTVKVFGESSVEYGQYNVPSPPSKNQIFNINISGSGESYLVKGTITNTANIPVQGVKVLVKSLFFVEGAFQETNLAEVNTDSRGMYLAKYNPDTIPKRNLGDPVSIFIIVSSTEDEKTEYLGKSILYSNVDPETEINLTVDAPSNADVSNYSTIKQSLTDAGFTDAILLQMVDNETTIEYAAQITGRTTQEITQIVDVLGIKKELTEYLNNLGSSAVLMNEEIIYALVATGSVTSFQGLKNISPKKLNSVIVSAIAQNIIPAQIADSIADIDDEWKDVYASFLSVAAEGPVDAKVLALGAFDDDNVERIVRNTYASNAHDLPSFWGELEENLKKEGYTPAPVVNRLELIFDVFQFADEFDLLAASIVNYLGKTDITHISELTSLEKEDWFNYIIDPITIDEKKGEEWPDDIPGETEEEKKSNYAKILFRRITTLFPMARFRHKLKNSTSYLWGHWDEIKTFLDNHPDFDFIEDINPVQISPQPDETLLGLLLMVQRIFRLTAQFEVIDGLLSRGYTSAVSIAHENGDDFVKKNEDITDGVDDAQTIYTAAVHTASQALFLMGTFNQQSDFDGESIPGVTEKLTPAPAIAPAPSLKNAVVAKMASQPILEAKSGQEDAPENGIRPVHPNIATLFGQQNQCLCPDCQSIFSPSAYLVDLLEFMGPETANVLFSRRPDLAETELSCRNTNGPVAYIDLVNEQLENAACTRTFFIQDNSNEDFAELLNQVLQSKLNIPQYVNEQFSIRGYPIDRNFYIQHKTGENRWYIVGDGWRYLVVEILKELPRRVFRITPFPQTGKNAQLRRALPEHTHRNAYILMKHLSFPWMMPFNLPYREVNQLLELRGSKRYRLHHILNETTDSFTLSETGLLQFFEMTSEQFDLIDNATPGKPWQLWGLHEQETNYSIPGTEVIFNGTYSWTYLLQNVAVFLHITGFTYDQLLDLLLTATVNGDGALFIAGSPYDPNVRPDLETADLSKIWLQRDSGSSRSYSSIFTTMARFIRLSRHVNSDLFLVDRVLMMTCDLVPLDNPLEFYKVMRVAEEFKVSPYRVATWCTARIDNVNLGRGPLCQLEELFISRIESGERANRWKLLLNDDRDVNIGKFEVGTVQDQQGGDIKVLLGGLKLKYDELSLIAHYEFASHGVLEDADAWTILKDVDVTLVNLGKMYRAADLSKALGLSIREYYTLLKYMSVSGNSYPTTVFYRMRDAVNKLKKFKISVYDLDYLLSENGLESIVWAVSREKESETIIKLNKQFATFSVLTSDEANEAKESAIVAELSSRADLSPELTRIVLPSMIRLSSNGSG